mgnify:CR=1 FL=1
MDNSLQNFKVLREVTQEKIKQSSDVNLTAISADYYYDQSDFIKQFKKLTQLSPKKFMTAVTKLGDEDTFWNFNG